MKGEPDQSAAELPAMAERLAHRIAIAAAQGGMLERLERIVAIHHRQRRGVAELTEPDVLARTRRAVDAIVERLRAKRKPVTEARIAEVVSAYRAGLLVVQSQRTLDEIGRNMGSGISETIQSELDQWCEHAYDAVVQHAEREIARSQRSLGVLIGCGVAALCLACLGATMPWN
jgi:hypothetical protein